MSIIKMHGDVKNENPYKIYRIKSHYLHFEICNKLEILLNTFGRSFEFYSKIQKFRQKFNFWEYLHILTDSQKNNQ